MHVINSSVVIIPSLVFESSKIELIAPNVTVNEEDFKINCLVDLTNEEQQNAEVILKKDGLEFY